MEKSSFFNSVGGDRKYKAGDFAEYFSSFIGNGIFPNPSTNLQLIANNNMTVTLKAGKAWINGYFYINTDDLVLPIDVADGVLNRVDRVVVRMDTVAREIKAMVKKGTFASSPVAPALQRDADIFELGIADIYIGKGATNVSQANITDLRLNNSLCGVVTQTVTTVDTTTLFNQYQSWFEQWTDEQKMIFDDWISQLQDVLDENTAANLLNLINQNTNQITDLSGDIGDKTLLETTDKSNLVSAVNEVNTTVNEHLAESATSAHQISNIQGLQSELSERPRKHESLTLIDNNIAIPSGADLNDYTVAGNYYTVNSGTTGSLINCPATGSGITLTVSYPYNNLNAPAQEIRHNTTGVKYFRRISSGNWTPWRRLLGDADYDVLFQYANDGKTAVANAVTAKGVSASPSDTFATLATKIGQINTGPVFTPGENIIGYSSISSNNSTTTYAKMKEIKIHYSGTVRVKFTLSGSGGYRALARLYKNGSPIGIERETTDREGVVFTEDIVVNKDDLIQVYCRTVREGQSGRVSNFSISIADGIISTVH